MRKPKKGYFLIALVVIVLLIFFHSVGWLGTVEKGVISFISPLQSTFYKWGIGFTSFRNYRLIMDENEKLRIEISRLGVDYIKLSNLEAENDFLRKELNFLKEKDFTFEIASVIGRQPYNDQIIIINKGTNDGLEVGLAATVNQGVIVGKIMEAEPDRAYVELLTNIESQLAVSLSHLTGTNGLLIGRVGNSLLVDLIPQDKDIQEDDIVITSGLEEKIPRALLIGRINEVESLVGQIFKRARVSPAINYQGLQTLSIIKSF